MIIYNVDKYVRQPIMVRFRGKEYEAHEPTVEVSAEIMRDVDAKFKEDLFEAQKWLIKKVIPDLEIETATKSELALITEICLKVLSGDHSGKIPAPLEIMEKRI